MPIEFTCTGCQKTLRVSDAAAGKRARCPDCGQINFVPESRRGFSTEEGAAGDSWSTGNWTPTEPAPETGSPFASPYEYTHAEPVTREDLLSKVSGPAIGLVVVSSINLCFVALQFVGSLLQVAIPGIQPNRGMQGGEAMVGLAIALLMIFIFLLRDIFVIYGAMQMKSLKSYSMAMTAVILAIIPCGSPCCVIQIPLAIWALVVLNDAEVKFSFRSAQAH